MYRDRFETVSQFVFFFPGSPPEIGTMRKLRWLYLNDNNLSSTIPVELEDVSRLAYLWLNDNKISGSINPGLFADKGFKHLQELLLHNNLITGTVSRPGLFQSPLSEDFMFLTYSSLWSCAPQIPKEIGSMPRVRFLSLYKNRLTGTIPSTLGLLTDLEILKLHQTGLTGSVPQEVCLLAQRGTLKTITIDCENVSCDCGCFCAEDGVDDPYVDLPEIDDTSESTSEADDTRAPGEVGETTLVGTIIETSTSNVTAVTETATSAPVKNATVVHTFERTRSPTTARPTARPTVAVTTPLPTMAPVTSVPTSAPPTINTVVVSEPVAEVPATGVTGAAEFMLQLPDFTKEALLNPESPQSLALVWFQADPGLAQYSFTKKLQRFGTLVGCIPQTLLWQCTPSSNISTLLSNL